MKKLITSLGLVLALLSLTASRAQDHLLPWHIDTYGVTSATGTFTDISSNTNVVKLTTEQSQLVKVLFYATSAEDTTPKDTITTAFSCAENNKTINGFPLGFKFNFCGKEMTHFVVSATGGVYFRDAAEQPVYTSTPTTGGQYAVWSIPYIFKSTANNNTAMATANLIKASTDKPAAYYLIEGKEGEHILTVQYDYMLAGTTNATNWDEWIFQFKFYEASGKIDFVVKDLACDNAITSSSLGKYHRILISITDYAASGQPTEDPYGSNAMNIPANGSNHRLFAGQTNDMSDSKGWDTIATTGTLSSGAAIETSTMSMRIAPGHKPEEGRTISFTPQQAPQSLTPFSAEDYVVSSERITQTEYSVNINYKQDRFPTATSMHEAGPIMAVISTSETPDYTLGSGIYYKKDYTFTETNGFTPKVLANQAPKITAVWNNDTYTIPTSGAGVTLSATGLKKGTTYYVHLYRVAYAGTNAPVYALSHTLSFTTSFALPDTFETVGLADIDGVTLKAKPADGLGVLIVKSNTPNVEPSGELAVGDKIGDDAEVVELLTEEKEWKLPLNNGEGCFLVAFSVNTDNHTYSTEKKYISVGTAYNGLPGVVDLTNLPFGDPNWEYNGFNKADKDWQTLEPAIYRDLPFGWTRTEIENNSNKSRDFGLGKPAKLEPSVLYAKTAKGVNVITPPIVADKGRILMSFNARWVDYNPAYDFSDRSFGKETNTDTLCFIEYAIEDGEWQMGKMFPGYDPVFTERDENGYYNISYALIADNEETFIGKKIRFRFTSNVALTGGQGSSVLLVIGSIDVKEDKICKTSRQIAQMDSLTTSTQVELTWIDPNEEDLAPAESFEIEYKPANDADAAWSKKKVDTYPTVIGDLDVNTVYTARITADCGTYGKAYTSKTGTLATIQKFPLEDNLTQDEPEEITVGGTTTFKPGETPFNRGFTTLAGALPEEGYAALATPTDGGWSSYLGSSAVVIDGGKQALSVGVRETEKNGWLLAPTVYVPVYDAVYPQVIRFKANCAYKYDATEDESEESGEVAADNAEGDGGDNAEDEWTMGSIGDKYPTAKLYVLLSHNGKFSMEDTVATIQVGGETILNEAFEFEVPEAALGNGRSQVAFYFQNPKANNSSAGNDNMMLFEIYDFVYDYSDDACFPTENLVRSDETVDGATYTWEGRNKSYKIFWGEGSDYTDSVATTETTYTLTGLNENTRYKVKVVGYCDEAGTEAGPNALTDLFTTLQTCHVPDAFEVSDITQTGATFSSTNEQSILTQRLVYLRAQGDTATKIFVQTEDQLTVSNLLDKTVYTAQTRSVCDLDSSELSAPVTFTTLADTFLIVLRVMPNDEAGTVTGAGRYEKGSQATISATPAENYKFVAWQFGQNTVSEEANYTFTVTAGGTYTALFEEIPEVVTDSFNITLNILPDANAGTVTGEGRYEKDAEATVSATPAANYDFVAWLLGQDTVSKEATYTFNVTADATYTALFVKKTANESAVKAAFNVSAKDGNLFIRNLKGLTVEEVTVYGLTGRQIGRFTPNSREDLILPVAAERALLLVRVASEQGVAIYKVYLH